MVSAARVSASLQGFGVTVGTSCTYRSWPGSYLSQWWWFFWTAIGAGGCDELYAGAQALYGLPYMPAVV